MGGDESSVDVHLVEVTHDWLLLLVPANRNSPCYIRGDVVSTGRLASVVAVVRRIRRGKADPPIGVPLLAAANSAKIRQLQLSAYGCSRRARRYDCFPAKIIP